MNTAPRSGIQFAVCLSNNEYPAALEVRKLYRVLPDELAMQHNMVRVIDESGEDYLYPAHYFFVLDLPPALQEAIAQAA